MTDLLSGDHDGTFIVPRPPERLVSTFGSPPSAGIIFTAASLLSEPVTLLSYERNISHFPSGDQLGASRWSLELYMTSRWPVSMLMVSRVLSEIPSEVLSKTG